MSRGGIGDHIVATVPVLGINRSCGLTVVSALTGIDTDRLDRDVQERRGVRKRVFRMKLDEVTELLGTNGIVAERVRRSQPEPLMMAYRVTPRGGYYRETVARWIRRTDDLRRRHEVFMVVSTHHVMLVRGAEIFDSMGGRRWRPVLHHPCVRQRVEVIYRLRTSPSSKGESNGED